MTAADRVLSLLSGVRSRGNDRWVALCPAHEDHTPSLSPTQKPGRLLLQCWAGCHIVAIVEALGINISDLFTDRPAMIPDLQAQRRRCAAERLDNWRQQQIRIDAEELRTRDLIILQIDACLAQGLITGDEAWTSLE